MSTTKRRRSTKTAQTTNARVGPHRKRFTLECVIRVRVGVRVGAVANQRNGALVFPNPRNGALDPPTRETDGWQRPQPAKRRVGSDPNQRKGGLGTRTLMMTRTPITQCGVFGHMFVPASNAYPRNSMSELGGCPSVWHRSKLPTHGMSLARLLHSL